MITHIYTHKPYLHQKKRQKVLHQYSKLLSKNTSNKKKSQRLGKILSRCIYYNLHYPEFKELSQFSSKKATYSKKQKPTTPTNNLKIGNKLWDCTRESATSVTAWTPNTTARQTRVLQYAFKSAAKLGTDRECWQEWDELDETLIHWW